MHAYVSVDGDLTAIGGYVNSMMDKMRKIEPDVPAVNVPALLRVTGLDAVSADTASSPVTRSRAGTLTAGTSGSIFRILSIMEFT